MDVVRLARSGEGDWWRWWKDGGDGGRTVDELVAKYC